DAGDHVRRAGRVLVAAGVAVQDRDRLVLEDDRSLARQPVERLRVRLLERLAARALEVQVDLDDGGAVLSSGLGGGGQTGDVRTVLLALRLDGLQSAVLAGPNANVPGTMPTGAGAGRDDCQTGVPNTAVPATTATGI